MSIKNNVTDQDIERVFSISRIKLEEDSSSIKHQVESVIHWVENLKKIDTEGITPVTNILTNSMQLREDSITEGNIVENILSNAPEKEHNFFVVPKIIKE